MLRQLSGRAWLALLALVACGAPRAQAPAREQPAVSRSSRPAPDRLSEPAPFFDVPGIQAEMVGHRVSDSQCEQKMRLVRDGEVVCEVELEGLTSCDGHRALRRHEVDLHSSEPLLFDVRTEAQRYAMSPSYVERCQRYVVRPRGACEVVTRRTCPLYSRCTFEATPTLRPGTGRLVLTLTYDGELSVGDTVVVDKENIGITDENGRVDLAIGAGAHELQIYAAGAPIAPIEVKLPSAGKDVVLEVVGTHCSCCGG